MRMCACFQREIHSPPVETGEAFAQTSAHPTPPRPSSRHDALGAAPRSCRAILSAIWSNAALRSGCPWPWKGLHTASMYAACSRLKASRTSVSRAS